MSIKFHYKGLSPEDRLFEQTPESSAAKAKGTLYEAWFDTLQTSPWYKQIAITGEFPNAASEEVWNYFGDLCDTTFSTWWLKTGYAIFAEDIPYRPIQELNVKLKQSKINPPSLLIEVPLNLSPKALQEQFNEIVKKQAEYQEEFNRWNHSTAPVHQYRESKLNYATIKKWMTVYAQYEAQKDRDNFKLYNFAKELELHPSLFRGLAKKMNVPEDLRIEAANVASEILKSARNLMAHATENCFPCTDAHPWAVSKARAKKG